MDEIGWELIRIDKQSHVSGKGVCNWDAIREYMEPSVNWELSQYEIRG